MADGRGSRTSRTGDGHGGSRDGHHGSGGRDGRHGDYKRYDKHRHSSRYYYGGYGYRPYWWTGFIWYGLDRLYWRPYYGGYYYEPYYYGTAGYVEPYATYDVPVDGGAATIQQPAQPNGDESERFLIAAEDAFRAARYEQAVRDLQHALIELPGDGRAMLFMSQALFATDKYQQAVGAAYQGMSLLDEKDWGFVAENYDKYYGNDDYVAQMKKLGEYIKKNPDAAYAYSLRGYHWGFLGYVEAARKDLKKAVELEPRDQMAAKLLVKFGGKAPEVKPEKRPELPPLPEGEAPLKLKGGNPVKDQ